jgi:hypothetical protein
LSHVNVITVIISNKDHFDYAIVGGGCFGPLTAFALIQEWSDARIVWFKSTYIYTASQNKSKIICVAYKNKDYVAFVKKVLEIW